MEQTRAAIASKLLNKQVTGFNVYNLNDSYFIFDNSTRWVVDTGIEIGLEDGRFSFSWNAEFEAFDYSFDCTVPELQPSKELYRVAHSDLSFDDLCGTRITDIAFDWDYFQEYDDLAQLKEEKIYVPVGIRLTFDNGRQLQLAAMLYDIHPETKSIVNARYDLQGELLVSFGEALEVATVHT